MDQDGYHDASMTSSAEPPPPELHELEADVMALVWELGECPVRAVLEELNRRSGRERKYTTVMTTMVRLADKGLLVRHREGRTDLYRAAMDRATYLEARAAAEVGAVVEHFGDAALVHFARRMDELDPVRREQLRRLARRG